MSKNKQQRKDISNQTLRKKMSFIFNLDALDIRKY